MKFEITGVTWFRIVELILSLIILIFLIVKLIIFKQTIDISPVINFIS